MRCAKCGARNRVPSSYTGPLQKVVCANCRSDLQPAPGLWERIVNFFRPPTAGTVPRTPSGTAGSQGGWQVPPPVRSTPVNVPPRWQPAATRPAQQTVVADAVDRFDNPEILALSAEEMRKRALKINPYKTAWIGRVDTIPPQSDERTALIDRGLILRGFLTPEQITEIHRVGDLWLKHHEATRLATTVAEKSADLALEQLKKEKAERKAAKKAAALERAKRHTEDVAARRQNDIFYAGRGVSSALHDRRSNIELLQQNGLPILSSPADLASALGIPVPQLRWLSFHGEAVERMHYINFEVPKRSGGTRVLSAPHRKLAAAQQWIFDNILVKLETEAPAHGFIRQHSTVTNARQHVGRDIVVNLDLSAFFPTITFPRVKGVFHKLGYSPAVATLLALLCTEAPRRPVVYDGTTYWVAVSDRALPQGACTSPAISNQVARHLDRRLAGMAAKHGWTYSRYADDLTFSAEDRGRINIGYLMASVRHVVEEERFALNPRKGRVQRRGGRQMVTGIVVNEKLSLPREEMRRLRAILHGAAKSGLASQNRDGNPHFEAWLRGKIAYVHMVDPARAARLLAQFNALPR